MRKVIISLFVFLMLSASILVFTSCGFNIPVKVDYALSDIVESVDAFEELMDKVDEREVRFIEDVDLSVTSFKSSVGESSVIEKILIKDDLVYVKSVLDIGNIFSSNATASGQSVATVMKMYEGGIANVITVDGNTTSSFQLFDENVDTDYSYEGFLDALRLIAKIPLEEGYLTATAVDNKHKLSNEYLELMIKIVNDHVPQRKKLQSDSFDDLTVILDLRRYISSGEITVTASDSKGKEHIKVAVKIDNGKTSRCLEASLDYEGTFHVSVKMNADDGALSFSTMEREGVKNQSVNFSITKRESVTAGLDCYNIEYATKDSVGALYDSQSMKGVLGIDKNGFLKYADMELNYDSYAQGIQKVNAKILYDDEAMRTVGKNGVKITLSVDSPSKTPLQNASISLMTKNCSDGLAQYDLSVTVKVDGEAKTVTALMQTPSGQDIQLNEKEELYLSRCDKIFSDLDGYNYQIARLNNLVNQVIKSGNLRGLTTKTYTVDEKTGIVYFTDLEVQGNRITPNTYAVPNYEDYIYFYAENTKNFVQIKNSQARNDAGVLASAVNSLNVSDAGEYVRCNRTEVWAYYYIETQGVYVLVQNGNADTALYTTVEPTSEMLGGAALHKATMNGNGLQVHNFVKRKDDKCLVFYECECGDAYVSRNKQHSEYEHYENIENGSIAWTMDICPGCYTGEIKLYNTEADCVKLTVSNASNAVYNGNSVYNDYKSNDFCDLIVTGVTLEETTVYEGQINIVLPDIRISTKYAIIGIEKMQMHSDNAVSITLCEGVKHISYRAFSNNVAELILPDSLIYLGDCLGKNVLISELVIPQNVRYMEETFNGCENLKRIVVNAKELGFLPYIVAKNLESLEINGIVKEFCGFSECKITEYTVPEGTVDVCIFFNSTLTKLILSSSVSRLGKGAVSSATYTGRSGLREIILNPGLDVIDSYCFTECPYLEKVWVNDGVATSGEKGNFVFPEGLQQIGQGAFKNNSNVVSVVFPGSCKSVSTSFSGCPNLEYITLAEGIQNIESYAFYECFSLKKVVLPQSILVINHQAFEYCSSLTEVVLNSGIKEIEHYAFGHCSSLERVWFDDGSGTNSWHGTCVFPENALIHERAFYNCPLIKNEN